MESALLSHPGVREAVVTAMPEKSEAAGGHRLVAYYVPEGADGPMPPASAASPTSEELRAHLQGRLPEHLVPSIFMPLAELPLNANGKVDRRALPSLLSSAGGEEGGARAVVAPRGAVEEVIAGIWAEVLGISRAPRALSVEESFFHLGGHSLLAIRMLWRLRAALGVDLPVQQVFESPTIAGLAAAVARALGSGDAAAGPALPPLAPRAAADPPRRSPTRSSGSGSSTAWHRGARPTTYPPTYGLAGPLAPAALAAALAEVVRRHQVLRARFVERDGEPRLTIAEAKAPGFLPLVDLCALAPGASARRSAELARLRAAEAERPFDLAAGPLLRAVLVRLGASAAGKGRAGGHPPPSLPPSPPTTPPRGEEPSGEGPLGLERQPAVNPSPLAGEEPSVERDLRTGKAACCASLPPGRGAGGDGGRTGGGWNCDDPFLPRTLLGAFEHALLLSFHHIVYDGWSEGVLLRELSALYDAGVAGTPSPLAEPAVQYADFAAWQRAWPPEVLGRQLAYWRGQLAGAPTALELPTDRPRPAVASFRGAGRRRLLGAPEAARLRQAARREGATLYMLLFAAFAATLSRLGGQEDLLVGTPIANRTHRELEELIGFFVNTLALRVRLEGDPDFRQVLASARQTALAAFAHQDLPFEALVEELRPERDLSRAPLVQAMLSLGSAARPEWSLGGGLRLARLPSPERTTAKLDLSLAATELADEDGGPSLLLELEYAADLFHPTTAERLLAHFATLLCGVAAEPERRSCRSRACRSWRRPSATSSPPSGTTRRRASRTGPCTASSRTRRRRGRTRSPSRGRRAR